MPGKIKDLPFPLDEVKNKLRNGEYYITDKAQENAKKWFEWDEQDIIDCFFKLEKKHFVKKIDYRSRPPLKTDYYRADNIHNGENIFTHFCIDDDGILEITNIKDRDAM